MDKRRQAQRRIAESLHIAANLKVIRDGRRADAEEKIRIIQRINGWAHILMWHAYPSLLNDPE